MGLRGDWPFWEDEELSEAQKQIVERNAACLTDPDPNVWKDKVARFEAALARMADEGAIKAKRAMYETRFDRHSFEDGLKDFSSRHFPCSVRFDGAAFGDGYVRSIGATFGEGDVRFRNAQMPKASLDFRLLHIKGLLDCTSLNAKGATFRNTMVDGLADWTDAKFGSISDFRQMKLDRAPEVARMDVPQSPSP